MNLNIKLLDLAIGLAAFFLISFCSCNKLDDLKEPEEPLVPPTNYKNAFDFVGIEHNRGLQMIADYSDSIISIIQNEHDSIKLANFFVTKFLQYYGSAINVDTLGIVLQPDSLILASEQPTNDVIASLNVPQSTEANLANLFAKIDAMPLESSKDANRIQEGIKTFEDQILSDTMLTVTDRSILLSTTSTYRHSLFFWTNLAFDESNKWNALMEFAADKVSVGNIPPEKWNRYREIAKEDVKGAVMGYVWGPWG